MLCSLILTIHTLFCAAKLAAPQPVRLLKTEWCSVEIVAGHSHDFSMTSCYNSRSPAYCFHTMLHWYGSEGTHAKLDLRRIIRKCVKDVRRLIHVLISGLYILSHIVHQYYM